MRAKMSTVTRTRVSCVSCVIWCFIFVKIINNEKSDLVFKKLKFMHQKFDDLCEKLEDFNNNYLLEINVPEGLFFSFINFCQCK